MSDVSGVDQVGLKSQVGKVSSKPQVSVDSVQNKQNIEGTEELKNIEIEMEAADHAFALMTEIRQKIEAAYNELSPSESE
ncbi:MAG: Flagellar hook-basal body complex protein FliE [Chlamydiae bacterium]|nr:Flagellar hook-basal body complex protein FliE [Chlamydiota bacterium]